MGSLFSKKSPPPPPPPAPQPKVPEVTKPAPEPQQAPDLSAPSAAPDQSEDNHEEQQNLFIPEDLVGQGEAAKLAGSHDQADADAALAASSIEQRAKEEEEEQIRRRLMEDEQAAMLAAALEVQRKKNPEYVMINIPQSVASEWEQRGVVLAVIKAIASVYIRNTQGQLEWRPESVMWDEWLDSPECARCGNLAFEEYIQKQGWTLVGSLTPSEAAAQFVKPLLKEANMSLFDFLNSAQGATAVEQLLHGQQQSQSSSPYHPSSPSKLSKHSNVSISTARQHAACFGKAAYVVTHCDHCTLTQVAELAQSHYYSCSDSAYPIPVYYWLDLLSVNYFAELECSARPESGVALIMKSHSVFHRPVS